MAVHLYFLLLCCIFLNFALGITDIDYINPHYGSLNGATKITIYGSGFAESEFDFGTDNENIGNKVSLVSTTQTYECDVLKDGTNTIQIVCYTRPMPEGNYWVRVTVDGVAVPVSRHCTSQYAWNCQFKPHWSYTPTITAIVPKSGPPGTLIRISGKIMTSLYGTNEETSTNGKTCRIKRVWFGSQKCELRDPDAPDEPEVNDELYGLELYNGGSSNNGYLICKLEGAYIGINNASIIIDGAYGRTMPSTSLYGVNQQDRLAMFEAHAVVSGIWPSSGSQLGGTKLTISGSYFDDTDAPSRIQVYVGDTVCDVETMTTSEIVCVTKPSPAYQLVNNTFPGARGLLWEVFTDTSAVTAEEISALQGADISDILTEATWSDSLKNYFSARMRGYFVAPRDGDYSFAVKGDDSATLYLSPVSGDEADKEIVAECNGATTSYSRYSTQTSERFTMEGGQAYYLEVTTREFSGVASASLAVHIHETSLLDTQADVIINEQQYIQTSSTQLSEHQILQFSNWPNSQSATREVQRVQIFSDFPNDIIYRLGMYGAFTGPLHGFDGGSVLEDELNDVVSISPESVLVSSTFISGGLQIDITFDSIRGDWPDLEVMMDDTSPANISSSLVSELFKGESDMSKYVVSYDGVPSPMIDQDADAEQLASALEEMLSVRCPPLVTSPRTKAYYYDYDDNPYNYNDNSQGTSTSQTEPFCGRVSNKNPNYLFREDSANPVINILYHRYVCFAYYGAMQQSIRIQTYYKDADHADYDTLSYTFNIDLPALNRWGYKCFDMREAVISVKPTVTTTRLRYIQIFKKSGEAEFFVDSVYIGPMLITTDEEGIASLRRLRPTDWSVSGVSVEGVAEHRNVTFTTFSCKDNLPLLAVEHTQELNSLKDSVSYGNGSWPSGVKVTVTREQAASSPVGGAIDLQWNGNTLEGISPIITADALKVRLETLPGMGAVDVTRSGTCAGYTWNIKWLTRGGDQPQITLGNDTYVTGDDAEVLTGTTSDGGVFLDVIPGGMLRTAHQLPQVLVKVNDVASTCEGNCSFLWSTSSTPTISNISPSQGSLRDDTELVITGTGFVTEAANNSVLIGGVPCNVTSASAMQLRCDIGAGPAGPHTVLVNVHGKGLADGQLQFVYLLKADSISPSAGSLAGGTLLTINGTGFGDNVTVMVGSEECLLVSATYNTIECYTPSASGPGSEGVVVVQGSHNTSLDLAFDYQMALTPVITSISSHVGSILGDTSVIISGTGFGSEAALYAVTVGDVPATIASYTDTAITATLPAMPHGSYTLDLYVENKGLADTTTHTIEEITYTFQVSNIFPLDGSVVGGSVLTITGSGFTDLPSDHEVLVGDTKCPVSFADNTTLVCTLEDPTQTHTIDNQGVHPIFGVGYAWNPSTVEIELGDTVQWTWTTPSFVPDIGYRVQQTDTPSDLAYNQRGFTSGETKTPNGMYEYKFTTPGVYYFWSGYVDNYENIIMRGAVHVKDTQSYAQLVTLSVNDIEADHHIGGSANPVDSSGCPPTTEAVFDICNSTETPADAYHFMWSRCHTPEVDTISPTQGPASDPITITGSGFSSTLCQNLVKIGDRTCNVTSATSSSLTCMIDTEDNMDVGTYMPVSVSVNNLGTALIREETETKRNFVLLPHIVSVSPLSGSTEGGATVVVSGSGFIAGGATVVDSGSDFTDVSVSIAGISCDVVDVSYSSVVCVTQNAYVATDNVTLSVYTRGQHIPAQCRGSCQYSFTISDTPTVLTMSPMTITSVNQTVTITGTGFGTDIAALVATIGDTPCHIDSVSDTEVVCLSGSPIAGAQSLHLNVEEKGDAASAVGDVMIVGSIASVSPSLGGLNGGTRIHISGFAYDQNSISVTVGGSSCEVLSASPDLILCSTPSGSSGTVDIIVTTNGEALAASPFTYSAAVTPAVSGISANQGNTGDSILISGSGFGASTNGSEVEVYIGDALCTVNSVSDTDINCTVGDHVVGEYDVTVTVLTLGTATCSQTFTYPLIVSTLAPSAGSFGGGQNLSISGNGFTDTDSNVTVCGALCLITSVPDPTQILCQTPPRSPAEGGTEVCDVVVSVGTLSAAAPSKFTYDTSLTPNITSVTPRRGGTGGGTSVTITGTGFGTLAGDVEVSIAGTECNISSISDTEIVCTTGAHTPSTETKVSVRKGTNGIALQDNADFQYIDVWSSPFTWGGSAIEEGDFVVIPKTMTVLLDTNTPVLSMLLIQGGKLIFDEVDVELHANNILITDGGLLQVGTETEPFQHQALIMMHGHPRSQELPIYGTKTLAVREGTLDLHGKPHDVMWTQLASTAQAGSSTLSLLVPVDWQPGDEVVIASTGGRLSQAQNEQRTIATVSGDGLQLTLTEPLDFKHLGETVQVNGGVELEARAEVGLLSHNVVVRGNNNPEWNDVIEACPDGFDPGEFATQTCFQGRFGEEIGSDQFGSQIMLSAAKPGKYDVIGRIENIEVTYAGQAYRLGRYAIHFHLNGDVSQSYVRHTSIHRSFNRAINIHGSHYLTVEHNVIYDVMGGALFLEDGIEIGNVFEYNLVVFVKASTSLQNDDITPAAFWVTNANNTYRHNHAAGGTHFGWWYRMHDRPDGPSYDPNYCPKKIPMGVFYNNTVHSQGWFGIWIFQEFFPMKTGACSSNTPQAARFHNLTAWHNEKGAEGVSIGAVQFIGFLLVQNSVAGIELKLVSHIERYSEERGTMLKDSIIAAYPDQRGVLTGSTTSVAIILPYLSGLLVSGITFINFDTGTSSCFRIASITGTTEDFNGGFTYQTTGLTFINSQNKIFWRWLHEGLYLDLDGSLTGRVNGRAIASSGLLPQAECSDVADFSVNSAIPGAACDASVGFHRWAYNKATPSSLKYKQVEFTNEHGSAIAEYRFKSLTHKEGWTSLLVSNKVTQMTFLEAEHLTNISYSGIFHDIGVDDYVIVQHNLTQSPDMFQVIPGGHFRDGAAEMLDPLTNYHGDWHFDGNTTMFSYMVSGRNKVSRRSSPIDGAVDRSITLNVYRCYFANCVLPVDPAGNSTVVPPANRPDNAIYWSDPASWEGTEEGFGGNYGDGTFGPPTDNTDVQITSDMWMVADTVLPTINKLYIYGVLELEFGIDPSTGDYYNFTLSCQHILIKGGRLIIGWEDDPFQGQVNIILRGNHLSPDMPLPDGSNLGGKALGVFGGFDAHGKVKNVTWTKLNQTAHSGSSEIIVQDPVDWEAGEQIVIASTTVSAWETETFYILAVSPDHITITLNGTLQYDHTVVVENIDGSTVYLGAEVGLLTRNIRIIGNDYPALQEEAFGARILVGQFSDGFGDYKGYARLSNVEFYHAGQEGWTDSYDPRFALAFLNVGEVTELSPSYVTKCSFNENFSPAIGVFGTNGLTLNENVIYHTVGSAVYIQGVDNRAEHNLVVLVVYPGGYNGKEEERFEYAAGFETVSAIRPVLVGNTVAGSERVGYNVDGEPCVAAGNTADPWRDNVAHAALSGVMKMPVGGASCNRISNFVVYKMWDFGVYYQGSGSLEVSHIISVDNNVGLFPMVIGPGASSHAYANKYIDVRDSLFIGTSAAYDCAHDVMSNSDWNIKSSSPARSLRSPDGGKVGMTLSTFNSAGNAAPRKPWINIMAYNAMYGLMTISDVTFAKFQDNCGGRSDRAMVSPPNNDDAIHPIRTQRLNFIDVPQDYKLFLHRPRVGTINPSDCVDMDCDGQKKIMLEDLDGSLTGTTAATYLAESEWQWDGDARRGLGDYRLPVVMLTDLDGSRIDVNTVAPYKGIIRDSTCVYHASSHAWECRRYDYQMLLVESMDSDTETRRVSPIALVSDSGYVDLINGPQDHGWCLGYTCQKRLSTFPFVMAMGRDYEMYMTGTTPQHLRFHLLNSNVHQAIRLGIYYSIPQRLDIYINGRYFEPTNAKYDSSGTMTLQAPTRAGEFMPNVTGDGSGTNYYDRVWDTQYVVIRGPTPVEIITSPLIQITFRLPAMTVDEFFGENLVNNLALLLGIPYDKIKIANAVSASRRRRAVEVEEVTVEISNPPSNNTNTTDLDPDALSAADFQNITSFIVNAVQLGTLGSTLNVTIMGFSIVEPVPPAGDDSWQDITLAAENGESYEISVQIPSELVTQTDPSVATQELSPWTDPPSFHMIDADGEHVSQLGSKVNPWQLTATLHTVAGSHPAAVLVGNATVDFWLGYANFSTLAISHAGSYILELAISSPAEAVGIFNSQNITVEVEPKLLSVQMVALESTGSVDTPFTASIEVVDSTTGQILDDLAWKGHTWEATASLYMTSLYDGSVLSGDTVLPVDPMTSQTNYSLSVDKSGRYFLSFRVVSTPADYDLTVTSGAIDIFPDGYTSPVVETSRAVRLTFQADYSSVVGDNKVYFEAAVYNALVSVYTNVSITNVVASSGSIVAEFDLGGATADVTSVLDSLATQVYASAFAVTFDGNTLTATGTLLVDGTEYNNPNPVGTAAGGSSPIVIIVVVCIVVLISVSVVAVLVYAKHNNKNFKKNNSVDALQSKGIKHRESVLMCDEEEGGSVMQKIPSSDEVLIAAAPPSSALYPQLPVQRVEGAWTGRERRSPIPPKSHPLSTPPRPVSPSHPVSPSPPVSPPPQTVSPPNKMSSNSVGVAPSGEDPPRLESTLPKLPPISSGTKMKIRGLKILQQQTRKVWK